MITLLQKALGETAIPEILTTLRQAAERERATSLMFRDGRAAEALAIKRQDGTARLVAGGFRDAVEHAAALWQERTEANAGDPAYRLTVTAPTNSEARAIGTAIRERRRAMGQLGPDRVVLAAADQTGGRFDLPLAEGDRVRLFARANALFDDGRVGNIGSNGSVLEVRAIDLASDISVFVGANNSGKTSVGHALQLFTGGGRFSIHDFRLRTLYLARCDVILSGSGVLDVGPGFAVASSDAPH